MASRLYIHTQATGTLNHKLVLRELVVSGVLHPKRNINQEKLTSSSCWHHALVIQALKMRSKQAVAFGPCSSAPRGLQRTGKQGLRGRVP